MKNLYYLLLLLTGTAIAQPGIQQPSDVHFCDDFNDGFGIFDLTLNDGLVLGALDPTTHTIGYFELQSDAQNFVNLIAAPMNYVNAVQWTQTIYVAVYENTAPGLIATASFQVHVNPYPVTPMIPDLVVHEDPNDGVAQFDLTAQTPLIINGQPGLTVFYYLSEPDAAAGINPLPFPDSYQNTTNPEQIWFRVSNIATGCFALGSFNLIVLSPDVIYIPDFALKNQLLNGGEGNSFILGADALPVVVDVNDDNEIQHSEALLVHFIDLPQFGINTLEGLQYFTNLRRLDVALNNLTSISLSTLTNLEYLNVNANNVPVVDISGLSNLVELHVAGTAVSEIDLSGCPNLQVLQVEQTNITELDISGLPNLEEISCYGLGLTAIDFSNATTLKIASISDNSISMLDLSAADNLEVLLCVDNNLTDLDLNGLTQLNTLWVDNNPITELDISPLSNLTDFSASGTLLQTIDASNNPEICLFHVGNSPNLESVNLKNGPTDCTEYYFLNNPNLEFVCIDTPEVQFLANYFLVNNMPQVNVNSYCSFTPGGEFNTITGVVRFDIDNDGCDPNDPVVPLTGIGISSADENGAAYTNQNGSYSFFTLEGDFTISPVFENQSYFNVIPPVAINFPTVDNSVVTQNFCIVPNGVHPDLEIAIAPITPARPGFEAVYKIVYKNKGNQVMSQEYGVSFFYNEALMDFVSSDPPADQQVAGGLNYSYTNLMPYESRSVTVTLTVNSPTDAEPVNIGDLLGFTAVIAPVGTDETPGDNNFIFDQTVVGSFDPNDKVCIQGEIVSPTQIGEYLHYVINFENTGNFYAQNIVVRDVINDAQFDVGSLQILDASHPVVARLNGNTVEFYFQDINLDSGGHGNILLKIKTLSTLPIGATVTNKADIFFDYNFPIETNHANTTFQNLKINDHGNIAGLSVYPNPSNSVVTVEANENIESVQLYDAQGRLLQTSVTNGPQLDVDISNRSIGIYFLKVLTNQASLTVKIIKN